MDKDILLWLIIGFQMFGMLIDKIKGLVRQDTQAKEKAYDVLSKNEFQMKSGEWRLCWGEKLMLVRTSKEAKDFYKSLYKSYIREKKVKRVIRLFVKNTLCKSWKNILSNKQETDFAADCIMINYYGNLLFYDLKNKLVKLNDFSGNNVKKFQLLEESGYFNFFVSPVVQCENNQLTELFLYPTKRGLTYEETYSQIIEKYKEYFKTVKPIGSYEITDLIKECKNIISELDNLIVNEIKHIQVNTYILHGDLHEGNIITNAGDDIYIIDYEHASEFPFFYDILIFPIFLYVSYGKSDMIEAVLDDETEIGKKLNELFTMQQIPIAREIKISLMLLTFAIYVRGCIECQDRSTEEVRIEEKNWLCNFNCLKHKLLELSEVI